MAYESTEWKCGDTITAEKMNKIESAVKELSDTVERGIDLGYECTEGESIVLYDGNVTTTSSGSGGNMGTVPVSGSQDYYAVLNVTFEGTRYECEMHDGDRYGADNPYDIGESSEYPFMLGIEPLSEEIVVYTAGNGTYSIKIEGAPTIASVSQCFEVAVKKIIRSM